MSKSRRLVWYGGQGAAVYDGIEAELRTRPHVAGVREFVEIVYEPSANRALIRLPRGRHRIDMSHAERDACDQTLDRMARASRDVFAKKDQP